MTKHSAPEIDARFTSRTDETIRHQLLAHDNVMQRVTQGLTREIALAAHIMLDTLTSGGKAVFFGNGGGAACAQYWASILLGRYNTERRGVPGIALTADTAVITNIGNDYGYHHIFARQVEAWVQAGDVVVGICANGLATNVLAGVRMAQKAGARTIGLSGGDGGQLAAMVDQAIVVPSTETPRIHEAHVVIAHVVCRLLDQGLLNPGSTKLVSGIST
ncbi:MAG: SIS domain-containing protein [Chloroflexi bacterium]|nr:MAG: SIS domain-containing protein [Chloroflexota bacterium]